MDTVGGMRLIAGEFAIAPSSISLISFQHYEPATGTHTQHKGPLLSLSHLYFPPLGTRTTAVHELPGIELLARAFSK
jgi:hypothetical protein